MISKFVLFRGATLIFCMTSFVAACGSQHVADVSSVMSLGAPSVTQLSLDGQVHEMVADPTCSCLLFAVFDGQRVSVDRFDQSTGQISQWLLGESSASGINSHIRAAADGTVWVSDDYSIKSVSTVTGSRISLDIGQDAPGQLAEATDSSAALPGTWISGFDLLDGEDLIVARNNVPNLEVWNSASGKMDRTVDLPAEFEGLTDLSVSVSGAFGIASRTHVSALGTAPLRLKVDVTSARESDHYLRGSFGPGFTLASQGGSVVVARQDSLEWTTETAERFRWAVPGSREIVTNPLGEQQKQTYFPPLVAGVVDSAQELWVLQDVGKGKFALLHWK